MDPVIANLDLDPPEASSPLRRGLVPALLVHAVFFAALALSLQWKGSGGSDELAGRPDTSVMGAPPAQPEQAQPLAAPPPVTLQAPAANEPAPAAPGAGGAASPGPAPLSAETPARVAPSPTPAARSSAARAEEPRSTRERAGTASRGAVAVKPSFDCAKARSRNERVICSDPELARLDRDTGRLHARAKAAARDPAAFRRQNDREWKQRESECHDKECLLAWYTHRREQLQQTLAQSR